jgi:hypothetical protein
VTPNCICLVVPFFAPYVYMSSCEMQDMMRKEKERGFNLGVEDAARRRRYVWL